MSESELTELTEKEKYLLATFLKFYNSLNSDSDKDRLYIFQKFAVICLWFFQMGNLILIFNRILIQQYDSIGWVYI